MDWWLRSTEEGFEDVESHSSTPKQDHGKVEREAVAQIGSKFAASTLTSTFGVSTEDGAAATAIEVGSRLIIFIAGEIKSNTRAIELV